MQCDSKLFPLGTKGKKAKCITLFWQIVYTEIAENQIVFESVMASGHDLMKNSAGDEALRVQEKLDLMKQR